MKLRSIILTVAAMVCCVLGANATTTVTFNADDLNATYGSTALSKTVDGVVFSFTSTDLAKDVVARCICDANSSLTITAPEGKMITGVKFASAEYEGEKMPIAPDSSLLISSTLMFNGNIDSDLSQTFAPTVIGLNKVSFTDSVKFVLPSIIVTLEDEPAVLLRCTDFEATTSIGNFVSEAAGTTFSFTSFAVMSDGKKWSSILYGSLGSIEITAPEGKVIKGLKFYPGMSPAVVQITGSSNLLTVSDKSFSGTQNSDLTQVYTTSADNITTVAFSYNTIMAYAIEVTLADDATTKASDAAADKKAEVKKIMKDGVIYIIKGDEVYGVNGNRVK